MVRDNDKVGLRVYPSHYSTALPLLYGARCLAHLVSTSHTLPHALCKVSKSRTCSIA